MQDKLVPVQQEGLVLAPPSPEHKRAANETKLRISTLLKVISEGEQKLASNYARLGAELLTARQKQYWIDWGYRSWGSCIAAIEKQHHKSRTQLYEYTAISEVLLPQLSESTLVKIGSSKASKLKGFVKQSGGRRVPEELLELAMSPKSTADEVEAKAMEILHSDKPEKGRWFTFGFFATDEEKLEIEEAVEAAMNTDPVVDHDIPEWAQRKEVMLRFAREYRSTYPG